MVSISNLSKSVKRKVVFSKVSFDIEDGQMLAIVGNKGTGKTTLVKIITGYEHATEGTISIDGQNCTDNPAIIRKCNAYIPVSDELYDKYPRQTVMENIKMFMHLNNLSLRDNMGTVSGLLDYFNLTTLEKVKLKKLNPIQQLKLSIARALIINPRVLVLDEPFNNLNQEEILEAVNIMDVFLQSGGSVVLTLTDIDLAAWLNCKVLILDGRTAVDGESYCRVYRNKNLPEDAEMEEQQEQYADDYYNDQYAGQYEYGYSNYEGDSDYNNAEDNEFNGNSEDNDGDFDRVYGEEVNNEEYDQAFRGPSFNEQFGTGQIFDAVATESDEDDDSQEIVENNAEEESEDSERLDAEFFRNQDNFRNQNNFINREDVRSQDNFRNHEDIRRQSIMRMQEDEKKRQEEERLRLEEEQRRQEEEERLRQEEEERLRQEEEEHLRQEEEERLRQEEEERRQEEERIRLEEEQREAERLRQEEEERLEELRRKEEEEAMPPRPELPPIRFTKTVEFFDNFGDVKEKRIGEEYFAVKDKMQGEEFLTKQFEALRILSNRRRELPNKED